MPPKKKPKPKSKFRRGTARGKADKETKGKTKTSQKQIVNVTVSSSGSGGSGGSGMGGSGPPQAPMFMPSHYQQPLFTPAIDPIKNTLTEVLLKESNKVKEEQPSPVPASTLDQAQQQRYLSKKEEVIQAKMALERERRAMEEQDNVLQQRYRSKKDEVMQAKMALEKERAMDDALRKFRDEQSQAQLRYNREAGALAKPKAPAKEPAKSKVATIASAPSSMIQPTLHGPMDMVEEDGGLVFRPQPVRRATRSGASTSSRTGPFTGPRKLPFTESESESNTYLGKYHKRKVGEDVPRARYYRKNWGEPFFA